MEQYKYSEEELDSALDKVFKAYDVRGVVGEELNDVIVKAVGASFVDEVGLEGEEVLIGFDMRPDSPRFAKIFAEGVAARGGVPVILGLASTDGVYFASGFYNKAAVQFTASHNPAEYNGIKMNRAGAKGLSSENGLKEIKKRTREYILNGIPVNLNAPEVTHREVMKEYVKHLRALVDLSGIRPLKVVVDTANGMGGFTVPNVFGDGVFEALPLNIVPLYFELDGSFPNHEANPLDVKNLTDLRKKVVEEKADLGLAFDGDADRCFIVDEKGEPVTASTVAAIISKRKIEELGTNVKILHSLTTSRFVPELISDMGAEPVRVRVGHSYAKAEMAMTGAVFGGEHSGHYYFGDFWNADSGILAAMHVIAELGKSNNVTMSELASKYNPYYSSGEINSRVNNVDLVVKKVLEEFPTYLYNIDHLDGLTVSFRKEQNSEWWWFNLRGSNTEPLLRLNCESDSLKKMEEVRDRVLKIVNS